MYRTMEDSIEREIIRYLPKGMIRVLAATHVNRRFALMDSALDHRKGSKEYKRLMTQANAHYMAYYRIMLVWSDDKYIKSSSLARLNAARLELGYRLIALTGESI